MENQFLFFFSVIGAFNGLLLGLYFFFFSNKHRTNLFLSLLLIALSIRVGSTMYFHFHEERRLLKYLLQIALSASLFVGPSLYLYVKSLRNNASTKTVVLHLVPLSLLVFIVGFLYPFEDYSKLWRTSFIRVIYYQWILYILLSAFVLKDLLAKSFRKSKLSLKERWLIYVLLGNLIIWIAHRTVFYTSYIFGGLSFSLTLYVLLAFLLFKRKDAVSIFRKNVKYLNKKISDTTADELSKKLALLMTKDLAYKDASVSLSSLAKQCNVKPHFLSQFLNDNYGKSFSLFINEYRIQEAKELLLTNNLYSIEAIGYDCGFNSKSAFFSTFKKLAGVTPAKFRAINTSK